jgi:hypothetical protein
MKWRWKMALAFAAVSALVVLLVGFSDDEVQRAAEQTRRDLRKAGFKTELSEFDFSATPEEQRRAAVLAPALRGPRPSALGEEPNLLPAIGTNAALVLWQQPALTTRSGGDLWSLLEESLDTERTFLDRAREAALAGPIRFHLDSSQGTSMLLPHLASLKSTLQSLSRRTLLDLHAGRRDEAWTNLLAATRLVTAWDTEPVEICQGVRVACASLAFNATWQVLQAEGSTDDQLARLQQEWSSVGFLARLPEAAAFERATWAAACRTERQQPLTRPAIPVGEWLTSPWGSFNGLLYYVRQIRYRHHGSFDDERDLLLHYRDREQELRLALNRTGWLDMRQLPVAVPPPPVRPKRSGSSALDMLRTRQRILQHTGSGQTLLERAVEAESRRRVLVTAIALERYRVRHGSLPKSLAELAPDLVPAVPVDFIDGQPLRYQPQSDGHFVLYSVGLDGRDDGGTLAQPKAAGYAGMPGPHSGPAPADLVWPRPASASEVAEHDRRVQEAQASRRRQAEAAEEIARQREEADRRATVQRLLAAPAAGSGPEPTVRGRPLSELLRNPATAGESKPNLREMLTLRAVGGQEDPGIAAFELPISYAALTNLSLLRLLVDTEPGREARGARGEFQECARATNGNCLLLWNTLYDPPGQHALLAHLQYDRRGRDDSADLTGPVLPFVSSNVFYFDDPMAAEFGPKGAFLSARLAGTNATYSIELKSPTGEHITTLRGTSTNGLIRAHWDLVDDQGRKYTNESIETTWQVTLTEPETPPPPATHPPP